MAEILNRIGEYSNLAAAGIVTASGILAIENTTTSGATSKEEPKIVAQIENEADTLKQPMKNGADLFVPERPTVDISKLSRQAEREVNRPPAATEQEIEQLPIIVEKKHIELNLKDLLHSDQNFGRFLQIWKKKNSRGTNFDRRGYNSFDAGKIRAEFSKDLQLKVYMGLFNNPPETAGVQMKKYYRDLVESESFRTRVHDAVVASSTEFDVPIDIIYGVIGVESGGHMHKVSSAGAVGVMQVKRDGAYDEMIRLAGIPKYQKAFGNAERWKKMDIGNAKDNIAVGVAYLRFLFDKYEDWNYVLMAYNAGPKGFEKSLVKLHNQKSLDRHSREREQSLGRGHVNLDRPAIVTYEAVREDFVNKFLRVYYPTFASVLADAGTDGINVFYPLKAGVLTEPTRIAVEEGRVQP